MKQYHLRKLLQAWLLMVKKRGRLRQVVVKTVCFHQRIDVAFALRRWRGRVELEQEQESRGRLFEVEHQKKVLVRAWLKWRKRTLYRQRAPEMVSMSLRRQQPCHVALHF